MASQQSETITKLTAGTYEGWRFVESRKILRKSKQKTNKLFEKTLKWSIKINSFALDRKSVV